MKEQIKAKEPVNLYRMLALVAITLDSIGSYVQEADYIWMNRYVFCFWTCFLC